MRPIEANLFSDIAWSTASVLNQTIQCILQHKLTYSLLPTLWDVDCVSDLERYFRLNPLVEKKQLLTPSLSSCSDCSPTEIPIKGASRYKRKLENREIHEVY